MISYRTIAFIFIFLNVSFCYGQDQEVFSFRYLSIGIAPLSISDISTPTLNVAVETNIGKTKTVELTYGIPVLAGAFSRDKQRLSQHEYRLAIRQIPKISVLDKKGIVFVGLEYFGVYDNYIRRSGDIEIDDFNFCYQSAEILRTVNGLRLELGFKLIANNFEGEIYTGTGVRRNNIQHYNVDGLTQQNCFPEDSFLNFDFEPNDSRSGTFATLDINFGVKLSYALRKFK